MFTEDPNRTLMKAIHFAPKSQPVFTLEYGAKYDVYALEPEHGMTKIMSWVG